MPWHVPNTPFVFFASLGQQRWTGQARPSVWSRYADESVNSPVVSKAIERTLAESWRHGADPG